MFTNLPSLHLDTLRIPPYSILKRLSYMPATTKRLGKQHSAVQKLPKSQVILPCLISTAKIFIFCVFFLKDQSQFLYAASFSAHLVALISSHDKIRLPKKKKKRKSHLEQQQCTPIFHLVQGSSHFVSPSPELKSSPYP